MPRFVFLQNDLHSDLPSVTLNRPCGLWYPYEEVVKGPACQYFSVVISSSVAPALSGVRKKYKKTTGASHSDTAGHTSRAVSDRQS